MTRREKERSPYAAGGGNDDLNPLCVARLAAVIFPEMVELLVGVLDHDDRRVHHGADGDRDASKGHDVGGQPQGMHGDEREQDRNRERDDCHQGRANVPEEDEAD